MLVQSLVGSLTLASRIISYLQSIKHNQAEWRQYLACSDCKASAPGHITSLDDRHAAFWASGLDGWPRWSDAECKKVRETTAELSSSRPRFLGKLGPEPGGGQANGTTPSPHAAQRCDTSHDTSIPFSLTSWRFLPEMVGCVCCSLLDPHLPLSLSLSLYLSHFGSLSISLTSAQENDTPVDPVVPKRVVRTSTIYIYIYCKL